MLVSVTRPAQIVTSIVRLRLYSALFSTAIKGGIHPPIYTIRLRLRRQNRRSRAVSQHQLLLFQLRLLLRALPYMQQIP